MDQEVPIAEKALLTIREAADYYKASTKHDELVTKGTMSSWPDVLSVYAVYVTTKTENATDVVHITDDHIKTLRNIFWQMNTVTSSTTKKTETKKEPVLDENGNQKKDDKGNPGHGTPIVNFTDAYNKSRLYISDVIGLVEVTNNELERFKVESGDVFFTRTSETIEEVGFASVIVENINNCIFSGFLIKGHPITNLLLPEYCSYCFRTTSFRKKIVSKAHMTTRATITGEILKDIEIAVPSIDVQKRIVAILDKLNYLTSNITDDLPAEIKMRNQQYEHYRDKLLGLGS